jgi:UDP-N-acetyl-2-amino-2-deoxyglucuronate dehydrogenase
VELTYITSRGPWYDVSWKGSEPHSGGIAMNIGIHFFDLLLWLFGDVEGSAVHHREPRCYSGRLALARADVSWFVSVDSRDLPAATAKGRPGTYRMIRVDDEEIEFSTPASTRGASPARGSPWPTPARRSSSSIVCEPRP